MIRIGVIDDHRLFARAFVILLDQLSSELQLNVESKEIRLDDSNKGSTTINGKIVKSDEGYTLIPSTFKTIQKIYSKKKKKKIWMLMPTTSSLKKSVYLEVENEELFWKQEQDWQKLYKSE